MQSRISLGIFILILLSVCFFVSSCDDDPEGKETDTEKPVEVISKKIIFETDMCFDVDDVGALGVLHYFADRNLAEILGVCYNEVNKDGAAAIDAINTWYGRADIPIGIYKDILDAPDFSKYLSYVAKNYTQDIPDNTDEIPSALEVYYEILSNQPDSSVTIISVGFLNNLADLLAQYPLLVESKVKELVVMGGINSDDFNFVRHDLVEDSEYVFENWPGQIVISQEGYDIYTGKSLESEPEGPIKDAYYKWFNNSFQDRSSWDQIAALYGVTGDVYFDLDTSRNGSLQNGYTIKMEEGKCMSLELKYTKEEYQHLIETMMCN